MTHCQTAHTVNKEPCRGHQSQVIEASITRGWKGRREVKSSSPPPNIFYPSHCTAPWIRREFIQLACCGRSTLRAVEVLSPLSQDQSLTIVHLSSSWPTPGFLKQSQILKKKFMPQNFFVFIHSLNLGHKLFSVYYTACFVNDIWTHKRGDKDKDIVCEIGSLEQVEQSWEHNGGNNGAGGDGSWEEVAGRHPRSTRAGLCPLKHPQPYLQPFLILDMD